MTTIDRITSDEIIRLFSPAIISLEEESGLRFQDYDTDHIWVGKDGKARKGIFVFAVRDGGIPRHYTADYLIAHYGIA